MIENILRIVLATSLLAGTAFLLVGVPAIWGNGHDDGRPPPALPDQLEEQPPDDQRWDCERWIVNLC